LVDVDAGGVFVCAGVAVELLPPESVTGARVKGGRSVTTVVFDTVRICRLPGPCTTRNATNGTDAATTTAITRTNASSRSGRRRVGPSPAVSRSYAWLSIPTRPVLRYP
jgi:hypothetical protein